jgi:excisionase family DNA binding protein
LIHTRSLQESRSVAEVAQIFRVTPKTIRRWRSSGRLCAYRVGRELRFPASAVERLAAEMAEGEASSAA